MKNRHIKLASIIITICITISALSVGCINPLGDISLPDDSINLDGTMFVTHNLELLPNNLRDDANYSIMVKGTTTEISEEDWHKWFGDEEYDVSGRLAIVLRLRYDHKLRQDNNASISITGIDNTDLNVNYLVSDLPHFLKDDKYIYLVLNIKHNLIVLTITHHINDTEYSTKYLINMIGVNFEMN